MAHSTICILLHFKVTPPPHPPRQDHDQILLIQSHQLASMHVLQIRSPESCPYFLHQSPPTPFLKVLLCFFRYICKDLLQNKELSLLSPIL